MSPMIEISNASKTFTMHLQNGVRLPVVSGVSMQVNAGECVVLSGPSGAGKSSILKMIFGNYRCDQGRISVRHNETMIDVATAQPRDILRVRRQTIGYVSQFLRAVPRVATPTLLPNRSSRMVSLVTKPVRGRERYCADSISRNGSGPCRRQLSPAENSSASTLHAASSPICRSCCWMSRRLRSTVSIARLSSIWLLKRKYAVWRWSPSSTTTKSEI